MREHVEGGLSGEQTSGGGQSAQPRRLPAPVPGGAAQAPALGGRIPPRCQPGCPHHASSVTAGTDCVVEKQKPFNV